MKFIEGAIYSIAVLRTNGIFLWSLRCRLWRWLLRAIESDGVMRAIESDGVIR